ncbi:retrovirus-related pol polyprotein from transposon TNT 1-94 [Tanacetum coccineum]
MKEEMSSLKKNHTWELVDQPPGQKLISCKWLYKIKEGIEGVQKPRYKARAVARGFTQRAGIDYNEVFSPVVRHTSIGVILSLTACEDYELEQLDVKTAFLHGNLEETIYMRQLPSFEEGTDNKVCVFKHIPVAAAAAAVDGGDGNEGDSGGDVPAVVVVTMVRRLSREGGGDGDVYDPFLKAGLGYTNPERLKKAIAAQPKMYDGDLIHSNKLVIHSTDSKETLEVAEESQNKMRQKMVQIDYEKLNALYETFVPQQELSVEQTYFSIPSTSNNGSTSKDVLSESSGPKMPTERVKDLFIEDVITVITPSNGKKVDSNHESANKGDAVEPKTVRMNNFSAPIIEDWSSDDKSEVEPIVNVKTVKPVSKKIKSVKTVRETEAPK